MREGESSKMQKGTERLSSPIGGHVPALLLHCGYGKNETKTEGYNDLT